MNEKRCIDLLATLSGIGLAIFPLTAACSDASRLAAPLLVVLAVVSAFALAVSWAFSLSLRGGWRTFVRWLPIVVLWVPVPMGFDNTPFPAGIAAIGLVTGTQGTFLKLLVCEIVGIGILSAFCFMSSRKTPGQ